MSSVWSQRVGISLALCVAVLPSHAFASGGSGGEDNTGFIMALVLGVGVAYMLAHFVVQRLQPLLLIVAGVEYMLLGFLLGPSAGNLIAGEQMVGLMPIIALAAGWVGLLRGTGFELADLRNAQPGTSAVVFWHHILPGLAVGAATFWFFCFSPGWMELSGPVSTHHALAAAIVLGCCAASDSTVPFDVLDRRYEIAGQLAPFMRRATRYGDVFVIVTFGILLATVHGGEVAPVDPTTHWLDSIVSAIPSSWATSVLFSMALGAGLGLLFSFFLDGDESENARFLALVGIITFASGAAYFLGLTPLAVNLTLGVVLVNSSRSGRQVRETLDSTDGPMTLVLLVLAGLLFRPPELLPTLIGLVGFMLLRWICKAIASFITASSTDMKRRDLYLGLIAHGDVTVAMVVSYRLFYDGIAADIAYGIVLASVIFHDLVAPRVLRSLLVNAGELMRVRDEIQVGLVVGSEWSPERMSMPHQERAGIALTPSVHPPPLDPEDMSMQSELPEPPEDETP